MARPVGFQKLMRAVTSVIVGLFVTLWVPELATAGLRFTGAPRPECKSFLLFESGIAASLAGINREGGGIQGPYLHSELGLMVNVNDRYAVGITSLLTHQGEAEDWRFGFRLRGRKWINRQFSSGVGAGMYFMGSHSADIISSFSLQGDVNYRDWLSLYTGVESYPVGSKTGVDWIVGVKGGSYTSAALGLLVIGAGILYISAGGAGD